LGVNTNPQRPTRGPPTGRPKKEKNMPICFAEKITFQTLFRNKPRTQKEKNSKTNKKQIPKSRIWKKTKKVKNFVPSPKTQTTFWCKKKRGKVNRFY